MEQVRLSDYLDKDKISLDDIKKKYPSQQRIPTRLLGAEPLSACYAEINPTTLQIRDVMLPAFMHAPFIDLGWNIHPSLRACIMFSSARAMGCAYCQAHCIGFGSLGRGGGLYKDKVAKAADLTQAAGHFTPAEVAAIEMAAAIGSVPSTVTVEHRINLAIHFEENKIEPIVYSAVMMAWLARFMDTIGVPLEGPANQNAEEFKKEISWEAGKHVMAEKDEKRMEAEIEHRPKPGGGLLSKLFIARHMMAAKIADRKVKRGIPNETDQLEAYMVQKWGFAPYYLSRTKDPGMRAALAFMIIRGLTEEQHQSVPCSLKWKICYLQACRCRVAILQAHFAYLCSRNGTTPEQLQKLRLSDFSSFEKSEQSALRFAEHSAGSGPFPMERAEMEEFTQTFSSAEVVDLVTTACIFSTLRASTAAFPPIQYEDVIKDFVEQEEMRPLVEYVESWENWDETIASVIRTRINSNGTLSQEVTEETVEVANGTGPKPAQTTTSPTNREPGFTVREHS